MQRSGTVSWVLSDSSDVDHPFSKSIKLGIRNPKKKIQERRKKY